MKKKNQAKDLRYNYAKNEEFATELLGNLLNFFETVKGEREHRETVWQEAYRAWTVDRTETDRAYVGRANIQMPQIRKEVETMSRRIFKGLFPEDYLRAEPSRLEEEDLAIANTQVVRHYMDNVMNMKSFAMPWIKQNVLYGTSPCRTFWREDVNEQLFKERYFVSTKEGILEPKTRAVHKPITTYRGPDVRAEDLYETWVYPHNASKPEDIKLTFWRTHLNNWEVKSKADQDMYHLPKDWENYGRKQDWAYEESQERLQQFGESGLQQVLDPKKESMFRVMEVWGDLLLPGEKYPVPCVVEILEMSKIVRIQRNPYWHQKAPFDWSRFILPPPGEFYGRGLPEATTALQAQVNDMLNQTMDSATLALNNITIINPAYAPNSESFEVEPGAVWWADPQAVKQFQFPDYSNTGIKNVGLLRNFITELSDNSPQLPDPIAGKARSTGQAQLAVNEWQTDLFTILDLISEEAMSPFAKKVHIMLQQNLRDDEIIRVTGKYAGEMVNRVIMPEDVLGNYNFKWKGALQIENQAIKTQQMMNFMKVFQSIPQDSGVKMQWDNFIVKLLRDGFLIKDVENVIETKEFNASTPPIVEEKICGLGGSIKVVPSDDDQIHIASHERFLAGEKDAYKRAKMQKHIEEHKTQMKEKQMAAQMMQQQMAMMMQQQNPQLQGGQGQGPGNPTDIPQATDQSNIDRGMRVEQ